MRILQVMASRANGGAETYSADMMEPKSMPMLAMKGASGSLSTNLTVCSSTLSIDFSRSWKPIELKYS